MNERTSGFTFLELLITITIFSLSIAAVYGAFSSGINAYQRGEKDDILYHEGQKTLNLISQELRSAFIVQTNKDIIFSGINQEIDGQEADRLVFFTVKNPSSFTSWKDVGLYQVGYYLEKNQSQPSFFLVRAETPSLGRINLSGESSQFLIDRVLGLNIRYYYRNEWREEWKESTTLPERVKITLSLLDSNERKKDFTTTVDIPCVRKVPPSGE